MSIFYECPSGSIVEPHIFHTILTGITQHGKTEVIKSLVQYYQSQGYTVLIIDVKDKTIGKADFAEYHQIPIYLEEVTDPLSLLGLLESNAKMQLRFQFPELIKACQRASTLREIRDSLEAVITGGKIHPVRKDKAEVLKLVLDKLIEEIERIQKSETLELKQGDICCMNLSNQGFSDAFKQIAVRSVIRYVRTHLSKIFVIFDEAHIQIPEGYSSASKEWIVKTIKEGASSKQFLLIADQTIKEVDKNVVTQCPFKIFGGQSGGQLEAQRTFGYMPVKKGVSVETIMRLPLGHFYLCTRDWTKLCYALPRGVPEDIGVKVAKSFLSPEYVRDHFMLKIEIEKEEDDEEMYRKKAEEFEEQVKHLLEENGRIVDQNKALEEKVKKLEKEVARTATFDLLTDEVARLQKQLSELQPLLKIKEALLELFPAKSVSQSEAGVKITLGTSLTEINLEDNASKEVNMTTDNPSGKLLFCAVQLHNKALKKNLETIPVFTTADLQKEAAEYGWQLTNMIIGKTMASIIREGWLVKEGNGYRLPAKLKINVQDPQKNE
jgi:hypothetical protein